MTGAGRHHPVGEPGVAATQPDVVRAVGEVKCVTVKETTLAVRPTTTVVGQRMDGQIIMWWAKHLGHKASRRMDSNKYLLGNLAIKCPERSRDLRFIPEQEGEDP